MTNAYTFEDELVGLIQAARKSSQETLESIAWVRETEALEGALLYEVLDLEDMLEGLNLVKAGEHLALVDLARRLEPVILNATKIYFIQDDSWDINPPYEEKVVETYGLAAINLRNCLRDLASRLAAIQNLLSAKNIAAGLCSKLI